MLQQKLKSNFGAVVVSYGAMIIEGSLLVLLTAIMTSLTNAHGWSPNDIALLMTARSAGALIMLYPSGYLSDRFGRKRIISLGFFLMAVFQVIVLFSDNYYLYMFGALLGGIGHGLCDAPSMSVLFDAFSDEAGPFISMSQLFFSGGGMVITYIASRLDSGNFTYKALVTGLLILNLVFLVMSLTITYPKQLKEDDTNVSEVSRSRFKTTPSVMKEGLWISICMILYASFSGTQLTWMPSFVGDVRGFGESFGLNSLTAFQGGAILGSLLTAYLLKYIHSSQAMVIFPLIAAALYAGFLNTNNTVLLIVFAFFAGAISSPYFGLCTNVLGELFPENTGAATGAIGSVNTLSLMLVSGITSRLEPRFGLTPFMYASMIALIILSIAAFAFRRYYLSNLTSK